MLHDNIPGFGGGRRRLCIGKPKGGNMNTIKRRATGGILCISLLGGVAFAQQPTGARGPLDPPGLQALPQLGAGEVGARTAFNPAMSVILDGLYYTDSRRGDIEPPAGFGDDHDHGANGAHGLQPGFNLRETEVVFSAAVDHYLDAVLVMALTGDAGVEVEEAYATTRGLPAGLQLKFGKFLSDVGYINRQHPHEWDFVDRPLMNELLFGDHGLQEKGVQLSWVPPTRFYSRLGVEILQGENEGVAQHYGARPAVAGTPRILSDSNGPRLFTGFAKVAPDLGFDHALQMGLFGGYARSYQYTDQHSTRHEDWDGDAWFAGTDWVYRYDAGRTFGHGNWRLQAEYMYRQINVDRRDVAFDDGAITNVQSFRNRQDGLYLQAVYGFAPRWTAGLRYDVVGLTNELGRGAGESPHESHRYAANITFNATEFSRFRLQVNHGRYEDSHADDGEHNDGFTQVFLQYILSLGAHGAHSF
jgi:hypothetical protein